MYRLDENSSHTNILKKLSRLGVAYNQGHVGKVNILFYCLKAWKQNHISRNVMISTLKQIGIVDKDLFENILNIENVFNLDPKFSKRQFSRFDAKRIVEMLIKYPKYDMYDIITNKIIKQDDTEESVITNLTIQRSQLNKLAKRLNLNSYDFKEANWFDIDHCYHDFIDPKTKDKYWFWYRFFPKIGENTYGCENISTRFYLKPKNQHLIQVWTDIMQKIECLPTVRKKGYTTKIPNYFNQDYNSKFKTLVLQRSASMLNQNDRIVIYCGDGARSEIIDSIQKYCIENISLFESHYNLATPLLNTSTESLNFAYVSDEFEIDDLSFNGIQAKILEEILFDFGTELFNQFDQSRAKTIDELKQQIVEIISKNITFRLNFENFLYKKYPKIAVKYKVNLENIGFSNTNN